MGIPWRKIATSGYFSYFGLLGGAALFEYLTYPWTTGRVIPSPYIMFYALATLACVFAGRWWGLAASLSWYLVICLLDVFYYHEFLLDASQAVRLLLQVGLPLGVSHLIEKRRFAERQRADLLHVLATGLPHKLNNQLMVIMGNSSNLLASVVEPAQEAQATEILEAAQRAAELVQKLQHCARQGLVEPELLDVTKLIEETMGGTPAAEIFASR